MNTKKVLGGNMGLAKVAVQCSIDTFVVNKNWFSTSTFAVKIVTFAKSETVMRHSNETPSNHRQHYNF